MDTIEPRTGGEYAGQDRTLALEEFLPYRLSVLSSLVSRSLARMYERRFGISAGEWRVLANLARFGPLSANGVCDRSAMDKVQVSRAVAKAVDAGLIDRSVDPYDRRRSVLSLTPKGQAIHDEIVPMAEDFESYLQDALTQEERDSLGEMLNRLISRANAPRSLDA